MALTNRSRTEPTRQQFQDAIGRAANTWYSACLRITRDPAQAEDAVQEALLSAWSRRSQFHGNSKLETWIHRIAINAALTQLRRRRPGADAEPDRLASEAQTPVEARRDEESIRDLDGAMATLSEMERRCFVLKHLEQWRLAEIADELGTGTGPVKQALFRAVRKLRGRMNADEA